MAASEGRAGIPVDRVMVGVTIIGIAAVVAVAAYRQAIIDWHYQLAGLADPFLGRPAPGWSIGWNLVWTVLLVAAVKVGGALVPHHGVPPSGRLMPRWWWILIALWGGYLAGSVLTAAGGGPERRPGTMRLELGSPLDLVTETAATCTTAPGAPGTVVSVVPDAGGVPYLQLANEATGEPNRYSIPGGVNAYEARPRTPGEVAIPGMPDRPEVLRLGMGWETTEAGPGRRYIVESAISFLSAYLYVPVDASVEGSTGRATFTAKRTFTLLDVNALIAHDPWPTTYELTASWRCDLAAPGPAPVPSPITGGDDLRLVWPTASFATGEGIPVELHLATSSDRAAVEVSGARIIDVEQRSTDGPGTARNDAAGFGIEQPAAAVGSGAVTAATYRFRLVDATAGTKIGLTIQGGSVGQVGVTLYNLVGGEPVPVFSNIGVSADRPGWPIEVDAEWLLEPIAVGRTQ